MHHYKHNIGDYRRRTAHLSLMEHGVYRQLLDEYYLNEVAIPNKTKEVYRRLSARTPEEQEAVRTVLLEFFEKRDDAWHHTHCDEIIAHYQANADKSRANGAKGGRPHKEDNDNQGGSKKKPRRLTTNNQKPETTIEELTFFEVHFWPLHPRKVGKPKALAAMVKALREGRANNADVIIDGLKAHLPYWRALIAEGKENMVPHPTTWINRDGWNDQVPGTKPAQDERPWHEQGQEAVEAKAREIGHDAWDQVSPFPTFKASVMRMTGDLKAPPVGLEELNNMAKKRGDQ
jgi:uncharacterized protein YdaU (DUF1376 family)